VQPLGPVGQIGVAGLADLLKFDQRLGGS
jgi:hypothetical protein